MEFGGAMEVARHLDVHVGTVHNWISRRSQPALEPANRLIELSKGKLSLEDVTEGTRPECKP